jgi:preprotein translocase subunit SecD
MKRRLAALLAAFAIAGCNNLLGETKNIRLRTVGPVLKEDEAIITARLRDQTSTLSPVYSFTTSNGETVIKATGSPPEASLQFLLAHRGLFEVKSEFGRPWFSQNDIVDASVGFDDQKRTVLNLRLSEAAAARVARFSATAVGGIVTAELDGEKLTSARVSGPIPRGAIQFSLSKAPAEAMLIATVLRTGALSYTPGSITTQVLP